MLCLATAEAARFDQAIRPRRQRAALWGGHSRMPRSVTVVARTTSPHDRAATKWVTSGRRAAARELLATSTSAADKSTRSEQSRAAVPARDGERTIEVGARDVPTIDQFSFVRAPINTECANRAPSIEP